MLVFSLFSSVTTSSSLSLFPYVTIISKTNKVGTPTDRHDSKDKLTAMHSWQKIRVKNSLRLHKTKYSCCLNIITQSQETEQKTKMWYRLIKVDRADVTVDLQQFAASDVSNGRSNDCRRIKYSCTHTHTTILRLCGICPGKPG